MTSLFACPCHATPLESVPPRTKSGTEKPRLRGAFLVSPLTDSNRRPPPYHVIQSATGRNRWQRFWLVRAVFAAFPFATGCHWLRPLGSINAPSGRPVSLPLVRA